MEFDLQKSMRVGFKSSFYLGGSLAASGAIGVELVQFVFLKHVSFRKQYGVWF